MWLDDVATRFDQAWRAGNRPRIEDYFSEGEGDRGPALLKQLVKIDIERRVDAGEIPTPAEYKARFPNAAELIDKVFESTMPSRPQPDDPRSEIGPYRVLKRLGAGGMGEVYLAQAPPPISRHVAVKIIKAGKDSPAALARFQLEQQALGRMKHPNIARVYNGGTTEDGLPYFAMEWINGLSIRDYCDEHHDTIEKRLRLFIRVCAALQHAHDSRVTHRDIKPENILISNVDGEPQPVVIDFGLAKAVNDDAMPQVSLTDGGALVGTLLYMSPEQTDPDAAGVGPRTDIYSLGVLLYELVTGTTPMPKATAKKLGFFETLRRIREEEFPRPSARLAALTDELQSIAARRGTDGTSLVRLLRGELDSIIMKAIQKIPTDRYESPTGLAKDVDRYLKQERVEAHAQSTGLFVRKFVRKYRRALIIASVSLAVLLILTTISTWQAIRATNASYAARIALANEMRMKDQAEQALQKADLATRIAESRRLAIVSDLERKMHLDRSLLLASEALRAANTRQARNSLYGALSTQPGVSAYFRPGDDSYLFARAVSPDGKLLATVSEPLRDGTSRVDLWELVTHQRLTLALLSPGEFRLKNLGFSADGKTITALYRNRRSRSDPDVARIVRWHCITRKCLLDSTLPVENGGFLEGTLSPNRQFLAAVYTGSRVLLWDIDNQKSLTEEPLHPEEGMALHVTSFSPDSRLLALGSYSAAADDDHRSSITVWDIPKNKPVTEEPLRIADGVVTHAEFDRTGTRIAIAYRRATDKTVQSEMGFPKLDRSEVLLWNLSTQDHRSFDSLSSEEEGMISALKFSPDGMTLAAGFSTGSYASSTGGIFLWNAGTRQRLGIKPLRINESGVSDITFSPDGKTIGAAFGAGAALYDVETRKLAHGPVLLGERNAGSLDFCLDGINVILAGPDGATLWDLQIQSRLCDDPFASLARRISTAVEEDPLSKDAWAVAPSPDGKSIAVAYSYDKRRFVEVYASGSDRVLSSVPFTTASHVGGMAFAADSQSLLLVVDGKIVRWAFTGHQAEASELLSIKGVSLSGIVVPSNGDPIAIGIPAGEQDVRLLDLELWNILKRERVARLSVRVEEGAISEWRLSPDCKTLAVSYTRHDPATDAGIGGGVLMMDVATGQRKTRAPIAVREGPIASVKLAFSPDSQSIAVAYSGMVASEPLGDVALWSVGTLSEAARYRFPTKTGWVLDIAFSLDGRSLAAGGSGVVVWDVKSLECLTDNAMWMNHDTIRRVHFTPNGKKVIATLNSFGRKSGAVFWNIDPVSWQHLAGKIANRNLTPEEWFDYLPDQPYRPPFFDAISGSD
jgi:serine/threonine protein kinase/WD40 repeat protein